MLLGCAGLWVGICYWLTRPAARARVPAPLPGASDVIDAVRFILREEQRQHGA